MVLKLTASVGGNGALKTTKITMDSADPEVFSIRVGFLKFLQMYFSTGTDNDSMIKQIVRMIENKTISFSDETVLFSDSNWMTPAIWLDVPNDWRNKYSA